MKVKLKDICEIQSGGTPNRSNKQYWDNGTINWAKISDIKDKYLFNTEEKITEEGLKNSSAKLFKKNSILYTIFATLGEACILGIDTTTNQAIANLEIRDKNVETEYIYYYLLSKKKLISGIGRGVAQNNINLSILKEMEINLADITTQRRIVDILNQNESIINKYKKQIALLDTLIKARFVEMFGDSPNNKYYSIKLGEVSISKGEYGANSASIAFTDNRARYIRITDINDDGTLNNDKVASINVSDDVKYKLEYGDIIFARTGATVGKSYCYQTNENQIFAGYLIKFKINVDKMVPVFIFYNTKMKYYDEWVKNSQGGAAQPNINEKKYSSFELINPPIDLQQQFAVFVKEVDKLKYDVQKSLEKTQVLFDSLMQKYFSN